MNQRRTFLQSIIAGLCWLVGVRPRAKREQVAVYIDGSWQTYDVIERVVTSEVVIQPGPYRTRIQNYWPKNWGNR